MGKNFAGVPRLIVGKEQERQKLILRFAEVLYPDELNNAMVMIENLRVTMVQDI